MAAIERSQFEPGASIFFGSPALIPDLILPVEVGIGGARPQLNSTLFFQAITTEIDSSQVSEKLATCGEEKFSVVRSVLQLKVSFASR